jgi:Ca2+-binding EF-hand superfamily protein
VFSLFQTAQIQQFKEAFSLIDQDGDGIVSEQDLKAIFASLGAFTLLILELYDLISFQEFNRRRL